MLKTGTVRCIQALDSRSVMQSEAGSQAARIVYSVGHDHSVVRNNLRQPAAPRAARRSPTAATVACRRCRRAATAACLRSRPAATAACLRYLPARSGASRPRRSAALAPPAGEAMWQAVNELVEQVKRGPLLVTASVLVLLKAQHIGCMIIAASLAALNLLVRSATAEFFINSVIDPSTLRTLATRSSRQRRKRGSSGSCYKSVGHSDSFTSF